MNDWFSRNFGAAIADVRERLVTEGWFGRINQPDFTAFPSRTGDELPSPEHLRNMRDMLDDWTRGVGDRDLPSQPNQAPIEQGIDIDR